MKELTMVLISLLYLGCGLWGIDWGLYSEQRESHLFPESSEWTPKRVAEIQTAPRPAAAQLPADVDPNPTTAPASSTVVLNDTDDKIAELYTRFLLYSNQPDEMVTFRALREMDPGRGKLDPKLYQYGGLFVYPIGVIARIAVWSGWIPMYDLDSFLKNPWEFSKFYVIGRMYVLFWGLIGVWIVYGIACELSDWRGGALAALLYTLMPVVLSMSHESKPHLPGSVLMLAAVLFALKYLESGRVYHRLMLALFCGLACGIVLSSVWILVLIPLVELLVASPFVDRVSRSLVFGLIAILIYAVTNPYVPINLFLHPELVSDNLANTAAVLNTAITDPWSRLEDGLLFGLPLLIAGSSAVFVSAGAIMWVGLWGWDWRKTLLLVVPALLVLVYFFALAPQKTGEYARFALFPNIILGIALAAGCFRFIAAKWYQATVLSIGLASVAALSGLNTLTDLHFEKTADNSRYRLASMLNEQAGATATRLSIGVLRDPAPYNFPPLNFSALQIVKLPDGVSDWPEDRNNWPEYLIVPLNGVAGVDVRTILQDGYYETEGPLPAERTPISWINKPLVLLRHEPDAGS